MNFFRKIMFLVPLLLYGCGAGDFNQDPEHLSASISPLPDDQADRAEYLVTFRGELLSDELVESVGEVFFAKYSHQLNHLVGNDPAIRSLSFLANLPRLQGTANRDRLYGSLDPYTWKPPWLARIFDQAASALMAVHFDSEKNAQKILNQWQREGKIHFYEKDRINRLSLSDQSAYAGMESSYWWLDQIKAKPSWDILGLGAESPIPGASNPVVAVLDSGVDFLHPALRGRMWKRAEGDKGLECPGAVHGCDTAAVVPTSSLGVGHTIYPLGASGPDRACHRGNREGYGSCLHGTQVSSIIAGNFEYGAPGICPMCRIMALRVAERIGKNVVVRDSAVIRAMQYVRMQNWKKPGQVRVINSSFGKFEHSNTIASMIRILFEEQTGVLVVAAAGNDATQRRVYPAAAKQAIAVAALDATGKKASYSNYGSWVDIAAPGGGDAEGRAYRETTIIAASPGGGVASALGTSMAAPMVSAVAGLVLAREPAISVQSLRKRLLEGADPKIYETDYADGFNQKYYYPEVDGRALPLLGSGSLDANAAVSGTEQGKRQNDEDRLGPFCGSVILKNGIQSSTHAMILLLFLFPLAIASWQRRHHRGNLTTGHHLSSVT